MLPFELQENIFKQFTLEKLFELNRLQIKNFTSLSSYIDYYLEKKIYKKQDKLTDCMFLIEIDEYKETILTYLYEIVTEIGIKIVHDVKKAGGSINYFDLAAEENPRNIYNIKIIIMKDSNEYEYKISSVGSFRRPGIIYYTYSFNHTSGGFQILDLDYKSVINTLKDIINLIKFDGRKIKQIRYYSEVYTHDYINLKSSIINLTEGYDIK